jgi:hypothetical protein
MIFIAIAFLFIGLFLAKFFCRTWLVALLWAVIPAYLPLLIRSWGVLGSLVLFSFYVSLALAHYYVKIDKN